MSRVRLLVSFTVMLLSASGLIGSDGNATPLRNILLIAVYVVAAYNFGRALTGGER